MGVIIDILAGIPLNAVLRERLVDKEMYIATLESENAVLKAENTVLKAENTVLKAENTVLKAENTESKAKLQKIESDKTVHGDICPYCQQPKGKLLDIQLDESFGFAGVKIKYYQCENCGKKYDIRQQPQY